MTLQQLLANKLSLASRRHASDHQPLFTMSGNALPLKAGQTTAEAVAISCMDAPTPRCVTPRCEDGGAERDRTDDLMLAKHALSQLSYSPWVGGPGRTRTSDLTLIRRAL